jgi:hypothetical protein
LVGFLVLSHRRNSVAREVRTFKIRQRLDTDRKPFKPTLKGVVKVC